MVSIGNNKLIICDDEAATFKAAADDFMQQANQAIKEKGFFNVALSGGNTPKKFFTLLSSAPYKDSICWEKINFFFGDERYVPANEPNSNYFMAHEYLFNNVSVLQENIYLVPTEYIYPERAAESYADTIRNVFNIGKDEIPEFDLMYLGLGTNAHTASLMPNTDLVKIYANNPEGEDKTLLTAALWVDELNMNRITLTPPAINNSHNIIFLLEGKNKAKPVWQVLQGPHDPVNYPAQLIKANRGKIIWYLDKQAASELKDLWRHIFPINRL